MKYKKGDILTDKRNKNDSCWSIWEVINAYKDDVLGNYYWIRNLYYETSDGSISTYMDVHDEKYMDVLGMRKLRKGEYSEFLAKVL